MSTHAVGGSRATSDSAARDSSAPVFDASLCWRLHPKVAVRPEPFGALLYHFGTRKLSFLKNRLIVSVVETLAGHRDASSALRAAGVGEADEAPYLHALGVLAASNMLVRQDLLYEDPEEIR